MLTHLRSGVTLVVLAVLLVVGGLWGWSSLSKPFPDHGSTTSTSPCSKVRVAKGDRISASQLLVSVFNGGGRSGLADLTATALTDQGFGVGNVGNAPKGTKVPYAQVWSKKPDDPGVRLVVSRLGQLAHVVPQHLKAPGIVVVVGRLFDQPVPGLPSVKVTRATTICSPPATQ
ncbi:MAG: LytR C-terminal domain-containing protein [Nocardioides sp.]